MKQRLDQFFNQARIAIDNALSNEQIQAALKEFGCTADQIRAGKALYETALTAQQRQGAQRGDQIAATARLNQARATAHKSYMQLVQLARLAFKTQPGIATKLAIAGPRQKSLSGWLLQAKQFYTNALSDGEIQFGLADYGVTLAKLQAAQAAVEAVEAANSLQEREKGEAQAATQARNAAIAALNDWLSDFLAVARIALADNSQLLEILGIRQP